MECVCEIYKRNLVILFQEAGRPKQYKIYMYLYIYIYYTFIHLDKNTITLLMFKIDF